MFWKVYLCELVLFCSKSNYNNYSTTSNWVCMCVCLLIISFHTCTWIFYIMQPKQVHVLHEYISQVLSIQQSFQWCDILSSQTPTYIPDEPIFFAQPDVKNRSAFTPHRWLCLSHTCNNRPHNVFCKCQRTNIGLIWTRLQRSQVRQLQICCIIK